MPPALPLAMRKNCISWAWLDVEAANKPVAASNPNTLAATNDVGNFMIMALLSDCSVSPAVGRVLMLDQNSACTYSPSVRIGRYTPVARS